MKKMLCKVVMLMVGVASSSVGYASMVETDTVVTKSVYVEKSISSQSNSSLSYDGFSMRLTKSHDVYAKSFPSFLISSDVSTSDPCMTISFEEDRFLGPFVDTHTIANGGEYWSPLNFRAKNYNFKFGKVGDDDPVGVMTVDGKIVCKDELKVAEVNTDKIRAKDIDVDFNNAADYVFADDYELKPLSEVEAYVKENKHLPGVPSADEFSNQGMNVSKMSNLLLEKVEELTLHVIQLQKEIEMLKADNEALRNGK